MKRQGMRQRSPFLRKEAERKAALERGGISCSPVQATRVAAEGEPGVWQFGRGFTRLRKPP